MAMSDYRLCDVCERKAFYDANLNYDQGADVPGMLRNGGGMMENTALDYVGDWGVICTDCAETHEVVIRPKPTTHPTRGTDHERD